METNFVALVPKFKFERGPAFVLVCDAIGLQWLRTRFVELIGAKPEASFVIGDGTPISSDDKCRLTVAEARNGDTSEIARSDRGDFTWRISRDDATAVAAKLFSLVSSNVPGHQYFQFERGRFRSVVVTKDEYSIDVVRAMRDGRGSAEERTS